jgi:branched-chain amino acid transport system substrate-binding protein
VNGSMWSGRCTRVGGGTFAVVLTVAALAACGSSGSSGSGSSKTAAKVSCPLHVLMIAPESGANASYGNATVAGAKAGVAHVNSTGGVLGCRLDLEVRDDGSTTTEDLTELQAAAATTNYALVSTTSGATATTAPYLNQHKLLMIGLTAQPDVAEPTVPYPDNFETFNENTDSTIAALQYALKKGAKKFALIVDDQSDGAATAAAVSPYIKAAGAQIVDTEQLDENGVDFTPAVERVQANNPQALLVNVYGPALGHFITDAHDAGLDVPIYGGLNVAGTDFKGLGIPVADLSNAVAVAPAAEASPPTGAQKAFIEQLQKSGIQIAQTIPSYANEYDAIILFAWAAEQTGSVDADIIAAKLHNSGDVTIPGLVGATTTGYGPQSGEWKGEMAVLKEGYLSQGMLPIIQYVSGNIAPAK